jgi:hypothetical protein
MQCQNLQDLKQGRGESVSERSGGARSSELSRDAAGTGRFAPGGLRRAVCTGRFAPGGLRRAVCAGRFALGVCAGPARSRRASGPLSTSRYTLHGVATSRNVYSRSRMDVRERWRCWISGAAGTGRPRRPRRLQGHPTHGHPTHGHPRRDRAAGRHGHRLPGRASTGGSARRRGIEASRARRVTRSRRGRPGRPATEGKALRRWLRAPPRSPAERGHRPGSRYRPATRPLPRDDR